MKKNKGFTLIELLAIIIVLAVIALITTPLVMNIIENARKKAFENSVYGIMETYRLDMAKNLNNIGKSHTFPEANSELKYNGKEMVGGSIFLDYEDDIEVRRITDGRYCADGNKRNLKVKKGDCQIDMTNAPVLAKALSSPNDRMFSGYGVAPYKDTIESVEFVMVGEEPEGAVAVSNKYDKKVMLWTKDEDNNGLYEVYIGAINDIIYANPDSSNMFRWCTTLKKIDLSNLDTITATNMSNMFYISSGQHSSTFTLNLGSKFNVDNVITYFSTFSGTGYKTPNFKPIATVKTQAEKDAILAKFPNIDVTIKP
jgi:bacterial surface protein 26-residue repeat/prepilin-type N-terminal cleavage/methylation domain